MIAPSRAARPMPPRIASGVPAAIPQAPATITTEAPTSRAADHSRSAMAGFPSCSAIADGFNGFAIHLANHDVMLWAVSRAPLVKLQAYKLRMGWTFPWGSSVDTDFNFDFSVSITEEQQREGNVEYNYRRGGHSIVATQVPAPVAQFAAKCGTDADTYRRERPGMSAFALKDGVVYHTYSTFARGLDALWGMYQWLDRAPKGRNETGAWWRRRDEY
jgi:predicted dithiol-disulfide oxidoreductase (DUF899 family)